MVCKCCVVLVMHPFYHPPTHTQTQTQTHTHTHTHTHTIYENSKIFRYVRTCDLDISREKWLNYFANSGDTYQTPLCLHCLPNYPFEGHKTKRNRYTFYGEITKSKCFCPILKKSKFSEKKKIDMFHISAQNIDCKLSPFPSWPGTVINSQLFELPLSNHYENTPIQITENFTTKKWQFFT